METDLPGNRSRLVRYRQTEHYPCYNVQAFPVSENDNRQAWLLTGTAFGNSPKQKQEYFKGS